MGFDSGGLSPAQTLDAIVDDSTRFSGADIALIKDKIHGFIDFWGLPVHISVDNSAADKPLGGIEVPAMGITPIFAYAMFKMDMLHNTAGGGNGLISDTFIQVERAGGAGYEDAISVLGWDYGIPGGENRTPAMDLIGHVDLVDAGVVNAMDIVLNFKWEQLRCNSSDLKGRNCRPGIRVVF